MVKLLFLIGIILFSMDNSFAESMDKTQIRSFIQTCVNSHKVDNDVMEACNKAIQAGSVIAIYAKADFLIDIGQKEQGVGLLKQAYNQRNAIPEIDNEFGYHSYFLGLNVKADLIKYGYFPDHEDETYKEKHSSFLFPSLWVAETYGNGASFKPLFTYDGGRWQAIRTLEPLIHELYPELELPAMEYYDTSLVFIKSVRLNSVAKIPPFKQDWVYINGKKVGESFRVDGISQVENGNCESAWGFVSKGKMPDYKLPESWSSGGFDRSLVISSNELPVQSVKIVTDEHEKERVLQAFTMNTPEHSKNEDNAVEDVIHQLEYTTVSRIATKIGTLWHMLEIEGSVSSWMLERTDGSWAWIANYMGALDSKSGMQYAKVEAVFVHQQQVYIMQSAYTYGSSYVILFRLSADGNLEKVSTAEDTEGCC